MAEQPREGPDSAEAEELRRHLSRLPPTHALRAAVERMLAGGEPTPEEIAQAFVAAAPLNLPSREAAEVEAAAWILGVAPLRAEDRPAAENTLTYLARLTEVSTPSSRRRARRTGTGCAVVTVLLFLFVTYAGTTWVGDTSDPGGPLGALLFIGLLAAGVGLVIALVVGLSLLLEDRTAVRGQAVRSLGRIGNPSIVRLLAERALDRDPAMAAAGRAGLRSVAARVREEHAPELSGQPVAQLGLLLHRIGNFDDPHASAAVVDLLARIGDARSLTFVRKLALGPGHPVPLARARAVLPGMEERIKREQAVNALVRPAEAPAKSTLLRPAGAASDTPAEQLVRPAGGPDGEAAGPRPGPTACR